MFRANGQNVEKLKKNKVQIFLNKTITEINTNKIIFVDNESKQTNAIDFDILLVQYGQTFDLKAAQTLKDFNKNQANRILVDQTQLTNIDRVYAIGNICCYPSKSYTIISAHGEASRAINDIVNRIKQYE